MIRHACTFISQISLLAYNRDSSKGSQIEYHPDEFINHDGWMVRNGPLCSICRM